MEIILGKTAGFCYGVENAITRCEEELTKTDLLVIEYYIYHEQNKKELLSIYKFPLSKLQSNPNI